MRILVANLLAGVDSALNVVGGSVFSPSKRKEKKRKEKEMVSMKCEKWRNEVGDVVLFIDDDYVVLDCVDREKIEALSVLKEEFGGEKLDIEELKKKYRRNGFKPFLTDRQDFHFFRKKTNIGLVANVAVNTEEDARKLVAEGFREYSANTVDDNLYLQYYNEKTNRQVLVSANSWSYDKVKRLLGIHPLKWKTIGSNYVRVGELVAEVTNDYYRLHLTTSFLDAELITEQDFQQLSAKQEAFRIKRQDNYNRDEIEDCVVAEKVWGTESCVKELVAQLQETGMDEDYFVYEPLKEELHSFE